MKMKKGNVKRVLCVLLIAVMVLPLVPCSASDVYAAESDILDESLSGMTEPENVQEEVEPEEAEITVICTCIPDISDFPDNDELFAGYVERAFYDESGISFFGEANGNRLTGAEKSIYDQLKPELAKIARGERTSTELDIDITDMELTYDPASKKLSGVDIGIVVKALMADCPYELYWFDKTVGYGYPLSYNPNNGKVSKLRIRFTVAAAYAGSEEYTTNPKMTGATSAAVRKAKDIVIANRNKSDYEKLLAYKETICEMVTYNDAAAKPDYAGGYGDPWQVIYVFDDNPDTNVVCEGYSKAFQYLCDMSTFEDNTTVCYTVTGDMNGGGHMWNIVALGGSSYLVDVTNCDGGTSEGKYSVGYPDRLFLVGAPDGTAEGYQIELPKYVFPDGGSYIPGGKKIIYVYDSATIQLYTPEILTLAKENYPRPGTPSDPDPSGVDARLSGYTLSLSGNIGINFYMELGEEVLQNEGAYMKFTLPGANHTEEEVMVKDAEKVTLGDKTYYVFSCGVAAKNMTDEIKAQIVLPNDAENNIKYGTLYTYTVKEYADYVIGHPAAYSDKAVEMVKAMLNYGGYTQLYFQHNTDNLANEGLQSSFSGNLSLDSIYDFSRPTDLPEGISYYGSSLMMTAETSIRHYFNVADGHSIDEYSFNDGELIPVKKGNLYYVEVRNISARNLETIYQVKVADKEDINCSISYGAYTYIKQYWTQGTDDSLKNMLNALYQYGNIAATY